MECPRLHAGLEASGFPGWVRLLVPNAISQRWYALPQELSERGCFRSVLRKQIVQKDDRCGHLPDLVCFLVERSFCGCDQQTQYECGQCANQARGQLYDVLGVRVQVVFRQQRPNGHPSQGAAKYQREHKQRNQKIHHICECSTISVMLILAPIVRACLKARSCDQVQPELDGARISRMGSKAEVLASRCQLWFAQQTWFDRTARVPSNTEPFIPRPWKPTDLPATGQIKSGHWSCGKSTRRANHF